MMNDQAPGMLQSALQAIIGKLDKLTGMMPRNKEEEKIPGQDPELGETPEHELGESKDFEAGEDESAKEMGSAVEGSPMEEASESPEEEGKPAHLVALDAIFKKSKPAK